MMAGVGGAGNKSKHILRQFPLIRFYTALVISFSYFIIQLIISHIYHSLILQMDAYHMLYNILSLVTYIVTSKASKGNSVKNTFGWRRIDVCGAVANLCFLSALGFSVVVECLQTIFHVTHHGKMHDAHIIGVVGILGLVVNAIVYLLIGGYTLHQSGFLCISKDGEDSVISDTMRRRPHNHVIREREGLYEIFRDVFGCALVVICAAIVFFWTDDHDAHYVDPCLTIVTVVILGLTSYKYATEACHILLLTIPNDINVATLEKELKKHFPEIVDVHEFHVWQLTLAKIYASVHVVLEKQQGYLGIQNSIISYLHDKGITHVTMQPEFEQMMGDGTVESPDTIRRRNKCFLPCTSGSDCYNRKCCMDEEEENEHDHDHDHHGHSHSHGHGHSHQYQPVPTAELELSHLESISLATSSINVQNPSLQSGSGVISGRFGNLRSDSLNNQLDLDTSFENVDLSVVSKNSSGGSGSISVGANVVLNQVGEESEDLSDDEGGQAELRPMI